MSTSEDLVAVLEQSLQTSTLLLQLPQSRAAQQGGDLAHREATCSFTKDTSKIWRDRGGAEWGGAVWGEGAGGRWRRRRRRVSAPKQAKFSRPEQMSSFPKNATHSQTFGPKAQSEFEALPSTQPRQHTAANLNPISIQHPQMAFTASSINVD